VGGDILGEGGLEVGPTVRCDGVQCGIKLKGKFSYVVLAVLHYIIAVLRLTVEGR
jgi:hypothetical protein